MFQIVAFIVSLILAQSVFSQTPPKRELRGVYLTTTNSLDWPKSLNRAEQQSSLKRILQEMKQANMNAVFFQVRARGDAYYRSAHEPWAENLTGTLGKDPGWDPLQFVIDESRKLQIEVHAWFNVYKIRGPVPPPASSPQHPVRSYPSWVKLYDNEWWFDPGLPEVNNYLLTLLADLAKHYDVDGICFDFIRYPGRDFPDDVSFQRFGKGKREDWRRENINRFVQRAYEQITSARPAIKMGAAPVGNYGGTMSAQPDTRIAAGALSDYFQDSRLWLRNGWLDYLAPQVYWALEFETQGPDFAYITRAWLKNAGTRHSYISTGVYKPEILSQINDQIAATRMLGAQGQVHFRYENVAPLTIFNKTYTTPALPPLMAWKDTTPPLPPQQVALNYSESGARIFWKEPGVSFDGDMPRYYVVYRSEREVDTNDPRQIIGTTSGLQWIDKEGRRGHRYAVTAVDASGNESAPAYAGSEHGTN